MTTTKQLAQHLRELVFGNNWTDVNLTETLRGIGWQDATTQVHGLNSIAALVFHINYYVQPVLNAMRNLPLNASDKYSFDLPPVSSEEDWQRLVNKLMVEAEQLAREIEKLDESRLFELLADEKYGSYYRNLLGFIEHSYYHLGQIVLIKKIVAAQSSQQNFAIRKTPVS